MNARRVPQVAAVLALAFALGGCGGTNEQPKSAGWQETGTAALDAGWAPERITAATSTGGGLVGWDVGEAPTGSPRSATDFASFNDEGELADLHRSDWSAVTELASLSDGRAVGLVQQLAAASPTRARLAWGEYSADGVLRVVKELDRGATDSWTLAAGPQGEVLVAWIKRTAGRATVRVVAAEGSKIGDSTELYSGADQGEGLAAAIGPDGSAVIAFASSPEDRRGSGAANARRIMAWHGTNVTSGLGFDDPIDLGPHAGVATVRAVVDGSRATVLWGSQDSGEETNEPYVVRAASVPLERWATAKSQMLGEGTDDQPRLGAPSLVVGTDNRATAAWVLPETDGGGALMTATVGADGRFAAPHRIDQGVQSASLAGGPNGELLLAWEAAGVRAALRTAGAGGFAASKRVGPPGLSAPEAAIGRDGTAFVFAADVEKGQITAYRRR